MLSRLNLSCLMVLSAHTSYYEKLHTQAYDAIKNEKRSDSTLVRGVVAMYNAGKNADTSRMPRSARPDYDNSQYSIINSLSVNNSLYSIVQNNKSNITQNITHNAYSVNTDNKQSEEFFLKRRIWEHDLLVDQYKITMLSSILGVMLSVGVLIISHNVLNLVSIYNLKSIYKYIGFLAVSSSAGGFTALALRAKERRDFYDADRKKFKEDLAELQRYNKNKSSSK